MINELIKTLAQAGMITKTGLVESSYTYDDLFRMGLCTQIGLSELSEEELIALAESKIHGNSGGSEGGGDDSGPLPDVTVDLSTPLTLRCLTSGTFTWTHRDHGSGESSQIYYSLNGGTLTELPLYTEVWDDETQETVINNDPGLSLNLKRGDTIEIVGIQDGHYKAYYAVDVYGDRVPSNSFGGTATFELYGNIMSLLALPPEIPNYSDYDMWDWIEDSMRDIWQNQLHLTSNPYEGADVSVSDINAFLGYSQTHSTLYYSAAVADKPSTDADIIDWWIDAITWQDGADTNLQSLIYEVEENWVYDKMKSLGVNTPAQLEDDQIRFGYFTEQYMLPEPVDQNNPTEEEMEAAGELWMNLINDLDTKAAAVAMAGVSASDFTFADDLYHTSSFGGQGSNRYAFLGFFSCVGEWADGDNCMRYNHALRVVDASKLYLPALHGQDYCYVGMFAGCDLLEAGPVIGPTLGVDCSEMFAFCNNLQHITFLWQYDPSEGISTDGEGNPYCPCGYAWYGHPEYWSDDESGQWGQNFIRDVPETGTFTIASWVDSSGNVLSEKPDETYIIPTINSTPSKVPAIPTGWTIEKQQFVYAD